MTRLNRILSLLLWLPCLLLCLAACGDDPVSPFESDTAGADTAGTPALPVDIMDLARTLAEACDFSEPLSENEPYLENHLFAFSDLDDIIVKKTAYVPAGITPEEILVFEAKTAEGADAIKDKLSDYVTYQAEQYGDYKPSEMPKLDDPVLVAKGTTVVYVVSADNEAAYRTVTTLLP